MKKVMRVCLMFVMLLALNGCEKDITKITDFERFADLTENTDRIEVTFDNNTGVPFYFTISDEDEITEVMQVLLSAQLKDAGKVPMAGDNTSFTIYQGEKQYSMSFRVNKEGDHYYTFSDSSLQDILRELAREAGAYETE